MHASLDNEARLIAALNGWRAVAVMLPLKRCYAGGRIDRIPPLRMNRSDDVMSFMFLDTAAIGRAFSYVFICREMRPGAASAPSHEKPMASKATARRRIVVKPLTKW